MGPTDSFKGYQAPHMLPGITPFDPPRDLAILEIGKGSSEDKGLPKITQLRGGQVETSPSHLLSATEAHRGPARSRESERKRPSPQAPVSV